MVPPSLTETQMKKERIFFFSLDGLPLNIVTTKMVSDVPLHPHDYVEVVFFQRGSAIHTLQLADGTVLSHPVSAGDCFAILPGELHAFSHGESAFYYNIIIGYDLLQSEGLPLQSLPAWEPFFHHLSPELSRIHLTSWESSYLEESLKQFQRELTLRRPNYHACAKIMMMNLLLTILRKEIKTTPVGTFDRTEEQVMGVIAIMEAHPERDFCLAKMAESAHVCISRFTRAMRRITGCSPLEYLVNLRLRKAVGMLTETQCTLKEIARECGFCDDNYLVKRFRTYYGMTPGEFRKHDFQQEHQP